MPDPRGDEVYDAPPPSDRPYAPDPSTAASGPSKSDVAGELIRSTDQQAVPEAPLRVGEGDEPQAGGPGGIQPEPLPEFDQRCRQDFDGLLYLGALERQFAWLGHTFVIRTLNSAELVEIGLLVKEYSGSDSYLRAYQGAVTAACVRQVDGKPIPVIPISDSDTALRERFNWIMRHWFPPTLDQVYQEYILLETRAREVIEAMGKASGSAR
jgi:hypothetical protein